MRFLVSVALTTCVASSGCAASRPQPPASSDAPLAQLQLTADTTFTAILTDAHGRSDSLPGTIRHIPHLTGDAAYGHMRSTAYAEPYLYSIIFRLSPIPDGHYTLRAIGSRPALPLTVLAITVPMEHDCGSADSIMLRAQHPATWTVSWHRRRPQRDTCWVHLVRS